jgi:SNF2-related domain
MTRPLFLKPVPASTPVPQQPPKLTGTVTLDGKRLAIRCQYTPSALGFFNNLPNSRFAKVAKQWTCQASPLAAYNLAETGLILDGGSAELAMAWVDHLSPIVQGSVDFSMLLQPPREAQKRSMEFCSKKRGSILEHGLGLGKSFCGVGLAIHWKAKLVLTLCPKAVLGVWRREMAKYCGVSHNVTVLEDGSNESKDKLLAQAMVQSGNFAINMIVCNYESAWRGALSKRMSSINWDMLICDEAHRIGNSQSASGKFACDIAWSSKRVLLLTGTPFETPLDGFGLFRAVEPALFGTSFSRFRTRYAVTHEQYKNKVLQLINMDEFNEKHKLVALRYETKDVWDLPELTHSTIPVTLSPSTMKLYRKLVKDSLVELERGEISASNAGVKLIKLAQMACGHVKDDEGRVTRFSDEKKQVLLDFLRDLPKTEKVVVFCRFTEDRRTRQSLRRSKRPATRYDRARTIPATYQCDGRTRACRRSRRRFNGGTVWSVVQSRLFIARLRPSQRTDT